MNTPFKLRRRAVHRYLRGGTLHAIASNYDVHAVTLCRWIKWYKEGGDENLRRRRSYKKSWNRTERELEKQVIMLKEQEPAMTVRKARDVLREQNIRISIKGIWSVWQRYGYAGFVKRSLSTDFRSYIPTFREARQGITIAEDLLKQNAVSGAAKVLNGLSSCSKNELLKKIPDRLLAAPRKLEKYYSLWGEVPYTVLSKKLRRLRERFEEKGFIYSAMRAGILESLTLEWSGETRKQLDLFAHLGRICPSKRLDPALKFVYNLAAGSAHLRNLEIKKALLFSKECEKFIDCLPKQSFLPSLLALYGNFGYYKKLRKLLNRHKKGLNRDTFFSWRARISATAGKYREYRSFLNKIGERKEDPADILQNAQYLFFEKGESQEAMKKVNLFFETSRKMAIRTYWDFISVFLAVLYSAQGKKNKGLLLIRRNLSLLRKLGNRKNVLFNETIVETPELPEYAEKIYHFHLVLLLKKASLTKKEKDYRKALEFARKEELLGTFHRFSVLFPEAIQSLQERGGNTELPKTILRLPVFNKKVPVFHIRLLGDLVVHKNQKYLRIKLPPKDAAFLIHLALRAGEPKKRISLSEIYRNFWRSSKNPSRNLSHLLVRIKKALTIPTHLLEVSCRKGDPVLINKGIYFTSDFSEFEQILAQTKALLKAGEWNLARNEYIRAFSLFRGEPFVKMYDFWSEDLRTIILHKLENEVSSFVNELSSRDRKGETKKLLIKVRKILPFSIRFNSLGDTDEKKIESDLEV